MKKPERCKLCHGTGVTDIFAEIECEECKGFGQVIGVYNMMKKIPYSKTNINIPYNQKMYKEVA